MSNKVQVMHNTLDRFVVDVERIKEDHEYRLAIVEQKVSKIVVDLATLVFVSHGTLQSSVKGLTVINENAKIWNGKQLLDEKEIQDLEEVALLCNVEAAKYDGPCIRTKRKTKKGGMVPIKELDSVIKMHDNVITKDVEAISALKNLQQFMSPFCLCLLGLVCVVSLLLVRLMVGIFIRGQLTLIVYFKQHPASFVQGFRIPSKPIFLIKNNDALRKSL